MVKVNRIAEMKGYAPKPVRRPAGLELPAGFRFLCELPEESGGGWMCMAPVRWLVDHKPKHNPESRTELLKLTTLVRSLKRDGLQLPPLVNDAEVVDGNRRCWASHLVGWEEIPVIYRPWAGASTFAGMNAEQKQHTPVEKAETWLRDRGAVSERMDELMRKAAGELGLKMVKWITLTKKMNVLSMLGYARRALAYCQPAGDRKTFLRAAVQLQADFNDQQNLKLWLQKKKSPVVLADRILTGTPLGS